MKSVAGWFALVLVIVLVGVSQTELTCYSCVHTETEQTIEGYESTCSQPFVPDGVDTCTGTECIIMWHDFGSLGESDCLVNKLDRY